MSDHDPRVLADGALRGLSAVVTGAGSGIGRAITIRLVELGADVTGIGRHAETLIETGERATGPGSYEHVVCDVRDTGAATAAVALTGDRRGLGLLVNNAGGQFAAAALDISPRGWASVLDLNLTSIFHLTKAAHPYLARTHGAVINLSLSGVERGGMGMAHSVAARAGVLGLTRTLALEWAADGIRLNCLGPGTVRTHGLADEATAQHVETNLIGRATPMRQATPVEDIAELVGFLASPAARLITGQLLHIDGGAHIGAGLHLSAEAYR